MKKVLVIEDDVNLAELICEAFQEVGWEVQTAHDGAKGFDLVLTYKPNVIIMDINMPIKDGLETLEELARHSLHVPVVMVTGYSDTEKMKRAWAAGAFEFLSKPFDPPRLLQIAESAFLQGPDYVKSSRERFGKMKSLILKKAG